MSLTDYLNESYRRSQRAKTRAKFDTHEKIATALNAGSITPKQAAAYRAWIKMRSEPKSSKPANIEAAPTTTGISAKLDAIYEPVQPIQSAEAEQIEAQLKELGPAVERLNDEQRRTAEVHNQVYAQWRKADDEYKRLMEELKAVRMAELQNLGDMIEFEETEWDAPDPFNPRNVEVSARLNQRGYIVEASEGKVRVLIVQTARLDGRKIVESIDSKWKLKSSILKSAIGRESIGRWLHARGVIKSLDLTGPELEAAFRSVRCKEISQSILDQIGSR